MEYDKIKITACLYDTTSENTVQIDDSILLDYSELDSDIELELIHDSHGHPIIRPKQPPRY